MKVIYLTLGVVFFGLGALGAVLPVLPTTPFLLLASACFARGSSRFHRWFTGTRLYEEHLASFAEDRAMTRKTKASLLTLSTSMMLLALFTLPHWSAKLVILASLVFLYYYFLVRIRTISAEEEEKA